MTDSPVPLDATVARGDTPTPSPATGGRFAPGAMVAGRYRIIALLGRGGMGEVYRADDTKLGHAVALKFLPRTFTADPKNIERLFAEVRLGRQVSHPNVCRIYDIGESAEGHFIAMEYVDGEDLASLLRRIGRLPAAKALDIARDLSAGLAAAHDVGIVHRDLKPANVMIDGRGRARITDFGLAVGADGGREGEVAGTPAYMAPEQVGGAAATPRSDLYSLGLILYELFTGKRLEPSERSSGRTPSISSIVRDIDPAIERVIMRCLERDPAARPPSAHAVIASLPGGDPLAAAVAAGETPSPAMVAAAGAIGDLRPAVAWSLFAASIAGVFLVAALASRTMLIYSIPLPKSPEVLAERAREVAEHLGYSDPPASTAQQWYWNDDYLKWVAKQEIPLDRWKHIGRAMSGLRFVDRSSPRDMSAIDPEHLVVFEDPPMTDPGMVATILDPWGRLVEFRAVPPAKFTDAPRGPADWSLPFREAGIDAARFQPGASVWSSPVDIDERRAWDGTLAERPDVPIHVEAGARHGRIGWFTMVGPWKQPKPLHAPPQSLIFVVSEWANLLLMAGILPPAVILAVRNLRRGRADRRAAFRLAVVCFATALVAWVIRADYVTSLYGNWDRIVSAISRSLWTAALPWLMYMALEPYVRRKWPQNLISWSRLAAGRWKDPMVGRDVVFGVAGGVALILPWHLARVIPNLLGLRAPGLLQYAITSFSSPRHVIFFLLSEIANYAGASLALLFLMVLVRAFVRKQSATAVILLAILTAAFMGGLPPDPWWVTAAFAVACAGVLVTLMMRWGLLSLVVATIVWAWLRAVPPTLDTSAWYFGRFSITFLAIAALAIYGFVVSLGSKPMFGTPLFEE